MKLSRLHITAAMLIGLLMACQSKVSKDEQLVARVGNSSLTHSQIISQIPESVMETDSLQSYKSFIDRWIKKELILQEVDRLDLMSNPTLVARIQRVKEEVIKSSFQDAIMAQYADDAKVSKEEARIYYQENKDKFLLKERYISFRHLVAKSYSDAENARRAIMRGRDWNDVSKTYSLYPELKIRESERYWPASTALSEYQVLNRYLQIIGITEISIIEKINNEYHFVQLTGERAVGEHPDLEWLITQIQDWLILEKKRRAYNSYLNNLYLAAQANNEIEIYNSLTDTSLISQFTDSLTTNIE